MLKFLKNEANKTRTENYAVTYKSTQSDCLDFFATVGALRSASDEEIITRFDRAYAEDTDIAMKTLFFARDIRGGLGERRVFRTIFVAMAADKLASVRKNLWAVGEFGRYDDLLPLLDTAARNDVIACIKMQFDADMAALAEGGQVSLLGKWLPSINAHNANTIRYGRMLAKGLGLTHAEYRKALSALRAAIAIVENNLREKDYSFNYEKLPSKALFKYRKAFARNDGERYSAFFDRVESGEAKINVGTLYPYDIIRPAVSERWGRNEISESERRSMDVAWNAQEDFTHGENAIAVVDGSGSMYCYGNPLPAEVALSLGIYFAERNEGAFKNHFITFSESPQLVQVKGKDIYEKVKYCAGYNEIANTNIQAVFELILATAVKNHLPQSELPATIYIISDMEFDYCADGADITNFEYAKQQYNKHGYALPNVVFWNVQSRNQQQPVSVNDRGVVLVSGASPRVFAMVTSGDLSPYKFMMDTLGGERYARIRA